MDRKRLLLPGFGMRGKVAFYDLLRSGAVSRLTVVDPDLDQAYLEDVVTRFSLPRRKARGLRLDAHDTATITELIRESDLVVDLLPTRLAIAR